MKYNQYQKSILNFFITNNDLIFNIARSIKLKYYSVPMEVEDLVLISMYQLNTLEEETEYFKLRIPMEKFIMSRIKIYMYMYCNEFCKGNHAILNNYIYTNEEELLGSCNGDYYIYEEQFNFLSPEEFSIIYDIKVLKLKRKIIANKHNMNLSKLRDKEFKILKKMKLKGIIPD